MLSGIQTKTVYQYVDPSRAEAYWRMLYNRQQMFERRKAGLPPPWTDDPILAQHRFTNAYRAADRVSQYLIRNVAYHGEQTPDEVVFRVLLFRLFNQIETWEILCQELGGIPTRASWSVQYYSDILSQAQRDGAKLWNNAYMITPPPATYGGAKHTGWLNILNHMLHDDIPAKVAAAPSLKHVYALLLGYQTVGSFFAMQWAIDLNYTTAVNHDENSFIIAGGGAVRGGAKLAPQVRSTEALIESLCARQDRAFAELGLDFAWLGGSRRLHLIDIQSGLCEFDKWCRVAYPEATAGKLYAKIKQKFDATTAAHHTPIAYWYPPKWGLNDGDVR